MIGKTISHYKITEKLGGGGMGVVYKAEDIKLKRTVALKFLPITFSNNEAAKERFIHEAQAASALQDNNICTIHEIDETEDGQLYICMDCYEGKTLKEKIEEGTLTKDESINIAIQIAKGLSRAHEVKIIHRDIKPANIFITERNEVKILDFGLAKVAGQTQLTQMGSTIGTIAYMSPEQARGGTIDCRTDIWSLGVLLYEMLSGDLPFKGEYDQAIIYSILNDKPEIIDSSKSKIQPELLDIIQKSLAKDIKDRYLDIDEMLSDLLAINGMTDIDSKKQSNIRRFLRKGRQKLSYKIIISVIFILLLIFGSLYIFVWNTKTPISTNTPSIAVLYLDNLGKKEDEFLSYGLTEDIIIDLSQAGLVRVITMNDVMKFRESNLSLAEIADSLRVKFILTGSFRRDKNQFRLTAQLVEPSKGVIHWSDRWVEPFEKITAVKTNLVIDVINILGLSPNAIAVKEIGRKPTLNAEAYEFYLKGKYYYRTRKVTADTEIAIGFLKKAIELDPEFVLAMVQLGEIYREKAEYDIAKKVYNQALVIANDNDILTAKAAIFNGMAGMDWRLGNMEKALEYTIEAFKIFETVGDFTKESMVLSNMGILYYTLGNIDKAMEVWKRALGIDRKMDDKYGEGIRLSNISTVYIELGEYQKALEYLMDSVPIYIEFSEQQGLALAYDNIAKVHFHQKQYSLAIEYFQKAITIFNVIEEKVEILSAISHLALCDAELGQQAEAYKAIGSFEKDRKLVDEDAIPVVAYWNLYQVYSKFDKIDQANICLEHAHKLLMNRAKKIDSPEKRKKFLNEVPENKEIIAAWKKKV